MPTAPASIRPGPDEYAPFHATYVDKAPDGDIVATLTTQVGDTLAVYTALSDAQALHRYAPGKWSLKEVAGHLADAERVFSYRLMCIARGDATPLPAFDENAYVASARFDRLPVAQLAEELLLVRRATIALLGGFAPEDWSRRGTASGKGISARALAWIIAGHERHHLGVVRERYLQG